jgi:hypothetical protein
MGVAASPSCVVFYASSVRAMGEMGCGKGILILRGFFLIVGLLDFFFLFSFFFFLFSFLIFGMLVFGFKVCF